MRRTMRHTSGGCVCMVRGADRAERWARDFLTVADIEIASELCVSCVLVCGGERSQIAMRAGTQSHVSEKKRARLDPAQTDDEYRHSLEHATPGTHAHILNDSIQYLQNAKQTLFRVQKSRSCRSSLSLLHASPHLPSLTHTSSLTPLTPAPSSLPLIPLHGS